MIIELIKAFLFGIVEGITEWLPISSTGHMILLDQFVKLGVSKSFYSMFEVVIQLGAIMAVVVIYWNKIWPFHKSKQTGPLAPTGIWRYVDKDIMIMWVKIVIACLPAGIIGVAFNDTFEKLFYNPVSVAIALIVFGIAFIWIDGSQKQAFQNQFACRAFILYGHFDRFLPIDCRCFPGNVSFRRNNRRGLDPWRFKNRCSRVHVLLGNSSHVRSFIVQAVEIWFRLFVC